MQAARHTLIRRVLFLATLTLIIVAAVWYFSRTQPIAVLLHTVQPGIVEATIANTRAGTIKGCRRARLAPPMGGQIARMAVHEGDRVQEQQVLLELWNDDLVAQVRLAQAEAKTAQAGVDEACLRAEGAERDAARKQRLQPDKLASDEDIDRAVTTAKTSSAACRAALSRIETSRAQLAVALAALERTRLRAPFEGSVAEVNGELGEYVTPSPPGIPTPPAVDLIDTSCLYISAPIDEVDAPAVKVGHTARITLDAFPGEHFDGIVTRIAPYVLEIEKQARTVEVEAVFANPDDYVRLLPGYSADLEIILEVRDNVLRIPTESLLEGKRVLLYRPSDGVLEERTIETGLHNWKFTQVQNGLQAGDRVVTSIDREGVTAGALVQPDTASP